MENSADSFFVELVKKQIFDSSSESYSLYVKQLLGMVKAIRVQVIQLCICSCDKSCVDLSLEYMK